MTLADRIADWLALAGSGTCEQIARGLRTRTSEIRQALREDPRFVSTLEREDIHPKVIYRLRPNYARDGQDGRDKTAQPSQSQRILSLLGDHRWHTHRELYALGCVAHSRLADLRKRGYEIEKRHHVTNGETIYEYRLPDGEVEEGASVALTTSVQAEASAPPSPVVDKIGLNAATNRVPSSTSSLCVTSSPPEPAHKPALATSGDAALAGTAQLDLGLEAA
jgi:hypothetical protein